MDENERGQVTFTAAEVYEEFFVPALFRQWAPRVADAAGIEPGQRVLDVACGTGVLARTVADRVGAEGAVVGLDVNEGMLEVARKKAPGIEWRSGPAEALPFDDVSFDRVVSQFGLMFFENRTAAIREMVRVLRRGGRLAAAVWASLDTSPGYAAVEAMLARLFGDEIAGAIRAPFVLGDSEELRRLFAGAGFGDATIATYEGTARFSSIRTWMYTDIKGWTLSDRIDDVQYERLLNEAEVALKPFVNAEGTVEFPASAHIVSLTKE
jgi:SAM-dependent methyltransferase